MKSTLEGLIIIASILLAVPSFAAPETQETFSLKVRVALLRSSKGVVQFSLYNKKGAIPDEHFKRYYRQKIMPVVKNSSEVIFKNLPKNVYAVGIHHDANRNGKIDKGIIFPTEGVGFSNYERIDLMNRPNFSDASFELNADMEKPVKVIYF